MASKKDMRREDLVVPYVETETKSDKAEVGSTLTSTLPMAAIFTRSKVIGWVALIIAIQNWLAESPAQRRTASTPGYFSVGMSLMSLTLAYLPLFLPPAPALRGTGTEAPAGVPPS